MILRLRNRSFWFIWLLHLIVKPFECDDGEICLAVGALIWWCTWLCYFRSLWFKSYPMMTIFQRIMSLLCGWKKKRMCFSPTFHQIRHMNCFLTSSSLGTARSLIPGIMRALPADRGLPINGKSKSEKKAVTDPSFGFALYLFCFPLYLRYYKRIYLLNFMTYFHYENTVWDIIDDSWGVIMEEILYFTCMSLINFVLFLF